MRLFRFLKLTLCSLIMLYGMSCSLMAGFSQSFMTPAEMEYRYGFTVMSRPVSTKLSDVEQAISMEEQKITFEAALKEAGMFQSAAYRRYQERQQLGLRGAADLMKAQALAQAAATNTLPPASALDTSLTIPGVTPLTAYTDFMQTGTPPTLATPFRGRIQTAFNNVLMSRLGASQLSILKKMESEWDMHLAFSTITINPGLLTRYNSAAEFRTRWSVAHMRKNDPKPPRDKRPTSIEDIKVIPIFPTYDSVGELNDAASMDERLLFLAALVQYGPAKGQGEYQRLVNDVRRLASASERVTLVGSPMPDNTIQYRVRGVRVADPFGERRPSGKTSMEPLTLPVVSLVMLNKKTLTAYEGDSFKVSMKYAGAWRRDRPWWDNIPPGNLMYGFWYDRGTRFQKTIAEDEITSSARKPKLYLPWQWPDCCFEDQEFVRPSQAALNYYDILEVDGGKPKNPLPVVFERPREPIEITHPFTQVLLVRATGDQPKHFYVNNIEVQFAKVTDSFANAKQVVLPQRMKSPDNETYNTYAVILPAEMLRNLAKAHGMPAVDDPSATKATTPTARDSIVTLTADNGAGPSQVYSQPFDVLYPNESAKEIGGVKLRLAYNFAYPLDPAPEVIKAKGQWQGKPFNLEMLRRSSQVWPSNPFDFLRED